MPAGSRNLQAKSKSSILCTLFRPVAEPEIVFEGKEKENIALREIETLKYIVVIYKETSETDGFIITAFITNKKQQFDRRKILWEKQK